MDFYPFILSVDNFCGYGNEWTVRKEYKSAGNYGNYADKRPIEVLINSSILNIDKPPGPTSHEVAYWVKTMFKLNRVGHGGTLEPCKAG